MVNPVLRQQVRRKLNLDKPKAIVGDGNGNVFPDLVNRKGYIYVRQRTAAGFSLPFIVRLGASFQMELRPGAPIRLGWEDGEQVALAPDVVLQIATGDDPLRNNAAHRPLTKFMPTTAIVPLSSQPTTPESLYVVVNSLIYQVGSTVYYFNASEDANGTPKGKVNLTSYIPAADNHRLAGLFLSENNEIVVSASTTQTMDIPIDLTDIQECVDNVTTGSIPASIWYLHDAQTVITQADFFLDRRDWINIPFAFRNSLNAALAIDDGILRAQIFDLDPMMTADPLAVEIFS